MSSRTGNPFTTPLFFSFSSSNHCGIPRRTTASMESEIAAIFLLFSFTSTASPTPSPIPSATYDITITKIFYDGQVYRVESDEYVEIKNTGNEPVDLAGWRLLDISEGYPSLTFPSYVLEPDQVIRVYTNEVHPEYGGFSFNSGKAVWNNTSSDTAVLYDAEGQEVSRKSY